MKYSWIKVKQHKFDSSKSWEENYRLLEEHHRQETEFLISLVPEHIKQSSSVVNQINEATTSIVVTFDEIGNRKYETVKTEPFNYETQKVWRDGW